MSSIINNVRVRFAPSPTGQLHLGGLRMALYNYIFARQNKGQFILRIEDTDQSRCIPSAAQDIEGILNWASLIPDESPSRGGKYGPYVQSQRRDMYIEKATELLNAGKAYRCFCSPMRLELLRRHQAKLNILPGYDGKCRELDESDIKEKMEETRGKHVIRFVSSNETNFYSDMVLGPVKFDEKKTKNTNDPVILKSDLLPTYHLANVVDDHLMKISHVLRGSEWVSSVLLHIQLYEALGWIPPTFAHFPLINAKEGTKLSKRTQGSSVKSWMDLGYQPMVLLNFLTNMGGGLPKEKQDNHELWSLEKIAENFNFKNILSHPGSMDLKRLELYSKNELAKTWTENHQLIVERAKKILLEQNINLELDNSELERLIGLNINRFVSLQDLLHPDLKFVWSKAKPTWQKSDKYNSTAIIEFVIQVLQNENIESKDEIIGQFKNYCAQNVIDYASFMKHIRLIMTNSDKGLPVHEIFLNLGQKKSLQYLSSALEYSKED